MAPTKKAKKTELSATSSRPRRNARQESTTSTKKELDLRLKTLKQISSEGRVSRSGRTYVKTDKITEKNPKDSLFEDDPKLGKAVVALTRISSKTIKTATSGEIKTTVNHNPIKGAEKRKPIYTNEPPIGPENDSSNQSIYDYASNSQSNQNIDDAMTEIIDKLYREKKINLKKKPGNRKGKSGVLAQSKNVVKQTHRKQVVTRSRLRDLNNRLEYSLIAKKIGAAARRPIKDSAVEASKSNENILPTMEPIMDITDHVIASLNVGEDERIKTILSRSRRNVRSTQDSPLISKSVEVATVTPVKGSVRPTDNRQTKLSNNIYKMTLNKPKYQSTPLRVDANQVLSNSTPWRINDEQVPRTFYFSTSGDHLPSYSSDVYGGNSSRRLPVTSTITSRNLSENSNNSGDMLHDTINLSNIENVEPANHNEMTNEFQKGTTKIILGNNNAGRSPLKPMIIQKVIVSPLRNTIPTELMQNEDEPEVSVTLLNLNTADDITPMHTTKTPLKTYSKSPEKATVSKYFGFESDFGDNEEEDECNLGAPSNANVSSVTIRKKSDQFKKRTGSSTKKPFRPAMPILPKQKKNLFDSPTKQAILKDVIAKKTTTKAVMEEPILVEDDVPNVKGTSIDAFDTISMGNTSGDLYLFETVLPQTNQDKRKCYTRIPKQKRYKSIDYVDDEVDDSANDGKKKTTNYNAKRKQQEQEAAEKELEQFANEFNAICADVDLFEISIEKEK